MSTFRRIAPWLILGPITGLLAEGVHRNIRANNPGLATLYAMAAVLTWIDFAAYGGTAFVFLQRLIF